MFVFMNAARLGVGMQGLGLTEVVTKMLGLRQRSYPNAKFVQFKAPDKPADLSSFTQTYVACC